MEDDDHSFWLYTACGLVRIARAELDAWAAAVDRDKDTKRIIKALVFDGSDGVHSRAHLGSIGPHVAKSPDGKLWFITLNGVSVVDPRHLPFNPLPPPVDIEQITADDKTYPVSNGMSLPALVRNLDIDYMALSLAVPEKVHFRVKLEGQDKDWRELANDRHVHYTNLAPKRYRFRVTACNNSGVWNEEGASLEFVLPPAWYQTGWFRALCVAAFLALLWAASRLDRAQDVSTKLRRSTARSPICLAVRLNPACVISRQTARWNHAVDMRITLQVLSQVWSTLRSLSPRRGDEDRQRLPKALWRWHARAGRGRGACSDRRAALTGVVA
jgi:hypothetical protein